MRLCYRRYFRPRWFASLLTLAIVALGCASSHKPPQTAESPAPVAQATATPNPPSSSGPIESIQISYAHADDYLESLSVTKFWRARVILIKQKNGKTFTVVRFQGGDPVWAIRNQSGRGTALLGHLPGVGKARSDALKSVSYGRTPPNFVQEAPDYGSPEPLETDKYYVFSVVRGSGALSFQAIKVQRDGSIEAYDAEPRAGTSYELCCDLPADFISAPDSQEEEPSGPPP
jgi:hypothetical protein